MSDIITPIVNSNGTSLVELAKQHTECWEAANSLADKLRAAMPHGRDYQNYPTDSEYKLARDQHLARIVSAEAIARDAYFFAMFFRK